MLTAIVPMRGGSERVKNKNLRSFGGQPLFTRILEALTASSRVDSIVVDTDSDDIESAVLAFNPAQAIVRRPEHLGRGDAPMNSVLENTLSQVEGDRFLQVHSTSPLLSSATIDRAIDEWLASPRHDSAFGVTRIQARFWTVQGEPINHDFSALLPTQDLEPLCLENSALYLFSRESLNRTGNRIGRDPLMIDIPALDALDIDTEEDFLLAEAVFKGMRGQV